MAKGAGFTGICKQSTSTLADTIKSCAFKRGNKLIEVTALSDDDEAYLSGRRNQSGSIVAYYDPSHTALGNIITAEDAGTVVALDIGPASTLHWSGNAYIENLSFDNDGSDAQIISFDFRGTGQWTKQTS